MIEFLKRGLQLEHSQENADLDAPETTLIHRNIILSKPFLKKIYEKWYADLMKNLSPSAIVVEIGSGGGFLKDIYPNVTSSDILPLPHCDLTLDATAMPFENNTLGAVVMVNVFHHIPDCAAFLKEANRTLCVGGKIVMVEPANCAWSRLIYQNLHHEPFDPTVEKWTFDSTGPMSSSNQALPFIVFERDAIKFEKEFPQLRVVRKSYHTPLTYLLSGGVSMRSLVPSGSFEWLTKLETLVSSRRFNMFFTLEIEKF